MTSRIILIVILWTCNVESHCLAEPKEGPRQLVEAARKGDLKEVKRLIAAGVDPNASIKFNITALWQAANKGHVEVVQFLLKSGAKTDHRDGVWKTTPLLLTEDDKILTLLTKAGAREAGRVLRTAAESGDATKVKAILAGKTTNPFWPSWLVTARAHAVRAGQEEIVKLLDDSSQKKIGKPPQVDAKTLAAYAGRYVSTRVNEIEAKAVEGTLQIRRGFRRQRYIPSDDRTFHHGSVTLQFTIVDGQPMIEESSYSGLQSYAIAKASPAAATSRKSTESWRGHKRVSRDTWPSFRGLGARGVAADQQLPATFDGKSMKGIAWKSKIAGLANACPVIWKDRVFICTAVSSKGDNSLRIGIYGAGDAVDDKSEHRWQLICLETKTGKPLWNRDVKKGKPTTKRHTKSSQANCTPATDGKHVVVLFPFGGLYCYTIDGKLVWEQQLGSLDSGAFNDRDYQWGFGSSPIIYRNLVVVQCDVQDDSFVAAYDLESGKRLWRKNRDEVPSWGTPTVVETAERPLLVANGSQFVRGYDVRNGNEIWRLGGNAAITVPTPFEANGLIYVSSGYRPIQPIFAIHPGARGDITLSSDKTTSKSILWSKSRGGPYLPTPIVYGDYLYTCQNHGILTCYDAKTGEQVYRKRLGSRGTSLTGSPVAVDGKLYLTAESGDVHIIRAGPKYERLSIASLGEYCLTTPAIAGGRMIFRTQNHLIAIGVTPSESPSKK